MIRLKDIMLESEMIGLAEKFAPAGGDFFVEVEASDELVLNNAYYFGLELSTGDICEVRGTAVEVSGAEGRRVYKFKIIECDEKYVSLAASSLSEKSPAAAKTDDGPTWAYGLKQMNSSYAIIVNSPAGFYTAEHLKIIAGIAEKGYGITKLTHAQRIVVLVKPEQLATVENELALAGLRKGVLHHGVRNVRACAGALCKWSKNNDAIGLSVDIDKELYGFSTKFDVKIAVSDCLRNCSESYCADIGFIGLDGEYRVVIGGRGSSIPFRALELAPKLPKSKVVAFVRKFVDWYAARANERERLCKTLQRIGTEIYNAKPESARGEIKAAFEKLDAPAMQAGDTVSESARMFEQYLRGLAVDSIRSEFAGVI
jgi:NAD(P)H-nitrite reductase large subunit